MENKEILDTGLVCSFYMLQYLDIEFNHQSIIHNYKKEDLFTQNEIVLVLKHLGLKSKTLKLKNKVDLLESHFPVIAKKHDGTFIFIVQYNKKEDKFLYQDPITQKPLLVESKDLLNDIDTQIVLATKRENKIFNADFKFGLSWFIKAFVKYKKVLLEVMMVSFFIQILSLLSPIFFQVTIDKVLVHNSLTTLQVLVIGLVVVSVFEVILSFLRTYLLNHTTNKIDVTLGSKLFGHLMSLPLSYFHSRKVGQISTRVRELDTIRSFVTSSALTLTIDLLFTVVFFVVMWFYSKTLTFIVLASIPFYILIAFAITPILQNKLNDKFLKGAENQAFLVESISGAETVKSLSLEPKMKDHWNNQVSEYVLAGFKVNNLGNLYSQLTSLINKVVLILILFYGAQFVINGDMTIGMLIAFNMLASRVSGPILHIAQLWNDFQQANISIKRLSDILNTKPEKGNGGASLNNKIKGTITLDNLTFRYRPDSKNILETINLEINSGEIIGIVGKSGSGKSTLTKLIQKLYQPADGRVLIDGIDISTVDPAWLRRQIGVVLQDNFLFNRSVRENIAIANKSIPFDFVINAAKLAGAHEFISELPEGYDTIIEEHGANLSGGQKQRIAIARALITNPKIMIFDEATSALDYESESIIQKNMSQICKDRTVIIIAHRLTAVRNADRIIVLDKGKVVEMGNPDDLLKKEDGFFKKLNDHQAKGL